MRRVVAFAFVLLTGCRNEKVDLTPIHADERRAAVDAEVLPPVLESGIADAPIIDASPPLPHAPTRMRFASYTLTLAEHGIDGTFEIWRDARLDDARVAKEWFSGSFDMGTPLGFETWPPLSAQVVLRDAHRRIVESLDLERPVARLVPVRLGDDVTPYLEVAMDTYAGAGRWGGTTHRFVRVEGGHSRWLLLETYNCALGCRFHYDQRPSGGFDILEWRHDYGVDVSTPVTKLSRIEVSGGTTSSKTKTVKGWVGEDPGTAIHVPADFPK